MQVGEPVAVTAGMNEKSDEEKDFIEIELLDAAGEPIANEEYEILLPDKSIKKGKLDGSGHARVDGVKPGACKVNFPNLYGAHWKST